MALLNCPLNNKQTNKCSKCHTWKKSAIGEDVCGVFMWVYSRCCVQPFRQLAEYPTTDTLWTDWADWQLHQCVCMCVCFLVYVCVWTDGSLLCLQQINVPLRECGTWDVERLREKGRRSNPWANTFCSLSSLQSDFFFSHAHFTQLFPVKSIQELN